jgi:hypothetical protein
MEDMSLRPNASSGSKGKTYRFYEGRPVWPFGHGLSFSEWGLSWGRLPAASVPVSALRAGLEIEVKVANRGTLHAARVVQLYVRTPGLPDAPLRALVAMTKVAVAPGATATLSTAAIGGTCAFCVYDAAGRASIPPATRYELSVGDGAGAAFPPFALTSE